MLYRKAYSPPRLKLQPKKDSKSGSEGKKEASQVGKEVLLGEGKKKEVLLTHQRRGAPLNLQDSVENSFREKLVIQVNYC